MKVQAEISLYPLRCSDLTEPIRQFSETFGFTKESKAMITANTPGKTD